MKLLRSTMPFTAGSFFRGGVIGSDSDAQVSAPSIKRLLGKIAGITLCVLCSPVTIPVKIFKNRKIARLMHERQAYVQKMHKYYFKNCVSVKTTVVKEGFIILFLRDLNKNKFPQLPPLSIEAYNDWTESSS